MGRRPLVLLVALAASGPAGSAQASNARALAFAKEFGFTSADVASVDSGRVLIRDLPTRDDNDVAIVGIARIGAADLRLAEEPAELETFLKDGPVISLGSFSNPPRVDDLDGLTLDPQELKASRRCKPGDCDFQMGAQGMGLVGKVDWASQTGGETFLSLLKQSIVDDVISYQQDGRMGVYVDNADPESVAEALQKSLEDSPYLPLDSPFLQYLLDYPKTPLPNTEDIFYWSKEKVRDPVTSIHHLIVHKTVSPEATDYTIADKHIADNHYFLATMELLWLLDDPGKKRGFYSVRLNRTRIDPPREFRGLLLKRIRKAMKKAMHKSILDTKIHLESALSPAWDTPRVGSPEVRATGSP